MFPGSPRCILAEEPCEDHVKPRSSTPRKEPKGGVDFAALLDGLPTPVYATDPTGGITYYNRAAADFAGRTPRLGVDKWCTTWKHYSADGQPLPHDQCPMAIAVKEQRAVRGTEAIGERPDGSRVPFMPLPTPIRDGKGNFVGAVNVLVDISARKQFEAELAARVREQSALFQFTDRLFRADGVQQMYEAALDCSGSGPVIRI
ncbi:MAG: PAS domain S-box protein [Alphaproteobacteria bacterium]|nr:PAS domain S-box protein [Alphaproteobacteria bacterium]